MNAQTGWIIQDTQEDFISRSICFINPMKGWIVGNSGSSGIVLETSDGGQTWFNPTGQSFNILIGVTFKNDSEGWMISNRQIFSTVDGAETWVEQFSIGDDPHSHLSNIFFVSNNIGWVIGSREIGEDEHIGIILKTIDGGLNWNEQEIEGVVDLTSVYFIDEKLGWITCAGYESPRLLKTNNGGIEWTIQDIANADRINAIFFADKQIGWMVGYPGRVLKTIDGGDNWTMQGGVSGALESCYFFNQNIGWIGGNDIWHTKNGGENWVKQYDINTGIHFSISFVDSLRGWTTANIGTILHTKDGGTIPTLRLLYPNGGEEYSVTQKELIRWQGNDIGTISIEYSIDKGTNWIAVADSIPTAKRNYTWKIPNPPSSECLVKIYYTYDTGDFDISDGTFLINRKPSIVTPNGGEHLYFERSYDIQWRDGGSQNIKIELSRDSGNSWEIIANSASALSGNLSWIVTPPKSNQCLFKITDNDFPESFDISDATFRIDTLITPYHDFPLTPGNKWFFSHLDETILAILSAEKDTILNDGINYTQITTCFRETVRDTFKISGNHYFRQTGDSVIVYPDHIFLNFRWQIGDTIITDSSNYSYLYVYDVKNENIFGRNLITYYLDIAESENYSCTDGIGFNSLNTSDWDGSYTSYLAGCIIDGIHYGKTSFVTQTDHKTNSVPSEINLYQNYPNPFNPKTKIRFDLMMYDQVLIEVYNTAGQLIKTLIDKKLSAGSHLLEFDAEGLSSGVYIYWLKTSHISIVKKMIYLK